MIGTRRVALADAYPHLHGGSQAQLAWLAAGLRDRGADVTVLTPGLGPLPRTTAAAGIPTAVVPATGMLARYGGTGPAAAGPLVRYWPRARRALQGADVAHLNDHRALLLYGAPARAAGAKVVWHVHALPAGRAVDRLCAAVAHVAVAPSTAAAARLRGLGVPVEVIPGHVATPAVRWRPEPAPRVVSVGRLHPTKGQDVLVEAVLELRRTRPELVLDLVGAGDPSVDAYERSLRRRAGGAVRFHGHLDDPWPLVAGAAVYVQPSRAETQGIAFAQALRTGIPVVASDLPALREQPGAADAVLVPPDDVAALVAGLTTALDGRPPDRGARPADDRAGIGAWLELYDRVVAA